MLVLDIGGDNYHVLQGEAVDGTLTNDIIGGILDSELEPKFAAKDYAGGATATANAFYSFFLARADHSQVTAAASAKPGDASTTVPVAAVTKTPVKTHDYSAPDKISVSTGLTIMGIFLLIVGWICLSAAARNRYIARYGIRINPHHPRNIRRYGVWTGQPGYGYSQRRYNRQQHHHHSSSTGSSSGSFWGSFGGGGSSSGGGAGRSSSSSRQTNRGGGGSTSGGGSGRSSSSSRQTNHGGGGSSSGGGSGRHSSGSSGGGNSGGGGASGGGGVGRRR
jgi:uncharacterized protein